MSETQVDVRYFPKDFFPSGAFPNIQFPKRQLLKSSVLAAALGPLANLSHSARPNCSLWQLSLGKLLLGKNVFEKVPNLPG